MQRLQRVQLGFEIISLGEKVRNLPILIVNELVGIFTFLGLRLQIVELSLEFVFAIKKI